ncbi:MAG: hypothetical protein NTU43_03050 [Bacteroidetes bacterium]|nr:hypothetical protein [Bacteroidota bacterium]
MKIIHKYDPLPTMPPHQRDDEDEFVENERFGLFKDVFALLFFAFITFITIAIILELKHEYNIDLLKGINTPFDNIYFEIKKLCFGI